MLFTQEEGSEYFLKSPSDVFEVNESSLKSLLYFSEVDASFSEESEEVATPL